MLFFNSTKPFLPENDQFNIVWIETREYEPKPFISFSITEENTFLHVERPLKVSLDLTKLKIAQKFLNKLCEEFEIGKKHGDQSSVLIKPNVERQYSESNYDLLRSIFHKIELETSQLVVFVQLYKSATLFSVEKFSSILQFSEARFSEIQTQFDYFGLRVQIKKNFAKFKTVVGPCTGGAKIKLNAIPHASQMLASFLSPRIESEFYLV